MKKYFLYIFSIIFIAVIAFCLLEPLKQAKLFLSVAGVHQNLEKEFDQSLSLLLKSKYEKYNQLNDLPTYHYQLLEKYHYTEKSILGVNLKELCNIYASEGEEWNPSDVIHDISVPMMKFEYAYCSDRSMILVVKAGGFGVTTPYSFFEIVNDELVLNNVVSFYYDNIFALALNLRFDKDAYASVW